MAQAQGNVSDLPLAIFRLGQRLDQPGQHRHPPGNLPLQLVEQLGLGLCRQQTALGLALLGEQGVGGFQPGGRSLEFLPHMVQSRDVLLPYHHAAADGGGVEQGVPVTQQSPIHIRPQPPPHRLGNRGCSIGGQHRLALLVQKLQVEGRRREQPPVPDVDRNHAGVQERLKEQHRQNTDDNGIVAVPEQRNFEQIAQYVAQNGYAEQHREYSGSQIAAVPALSEQQHHRPQQESERHQKHYKITGAILVLVRPVSAQNKAEDQLVQVIGKYQKYGKNVSHQRWPEGVQQALGVLRLINDLRHPQHSQGQGELEHIIAVPAKPAHKIGGEQLILEQPQQRPAHHQPAHQHRRPSDIPAQDAL